MLVLPAEITNQQARAAAATLQQGMQTLDGSEVVLDASAMVKFDSSALAVLLQCRREALQAGKRFEVRGTPSRLRDLATLYGIEGLLQLA
jgi:phospholipid transport system transporter-binding protein